MNTSPAGRAMIEGFEGVVLHWYRDVAGIETGGCGHVRRPGDPDTFGQGEVDAWLANDLRVAESAVNSHSPPGIGQNQFDACVSLTFNIGGGAFVGSSVCKLMVTGDYLAAADAFLLWDKAVVGGKLKVVPDLAKRRAAERAVFLRDASTLDG